MSAARIPGVSQAEENLILKHLRRLLPQGTRVYVYGSRFRGNQKTYSDLDLSLEGQGKIQTSALDALEETFAESDIPFKVDLSDFQSLDEDFQSHIKKNSLSFLL